METFDHSLDCKRLAVVGFARALEPSGHLTGWQRVHDTDSKQARRETQMLDSGWEEAVYYTLGTGHCLEGTSMCACLAEGTRSQESMKAEEERRTAMLGCQNL